MKKWNKETTEKCGITNLNNPPDFFNPPELKNKRGCVRFNLSDDWLNNQLNKIFKVRERLYFLISEYFQRKNCSNKCPWKQCQMHTRNVNYPNFQWQPGDLNSEMSGEFTSFIYAIRFRKQSTEITWNANKKLVLVEILTLLIIRTIDATYYLPKETFNINE